MESRQAAQCERLEWRERTRAPKYHVTNGGISSSPTTHADGGEQYTQPENLENQSSQSRLCRPLLPERSLLEVSRVQPAQMLPTQS